MAKRSLRDKYKRKLTQVSKSLVSDVNVLDNIAQAYFDDYPKIAHKLLMVRCALQELTDALDKVNEEI